MNRNCKQCKSYDECLDDASFYGIQFDPDVAAKHCTGFKPITNADHIRAMSDEELTKFLANYAFNRERRLIMNIHDATEQAYKNGYKQGKQDAVVHGRWEEQKEYDFEERDYFISGYTCSCCGFWYLNVKKYNYCPNCGAKMDLPQITQNTEDALHKMGENVHGGKA